LRMKSAMFLATATVASAQIIGAYNTGLAYANRAPVGGLVSPYGLRAPVASYGAYNLGAPATYGAYPAYAAAPVARAPVARAPAPAPVVKAPEEASNPMNMVLLYYLMSNDSVDVGGNSYDTYECDSAGANCKTDDGMDMMDILMMQSMMKSGNIGFEALLWPSLNSKDKYVANKAGTGYIKTTDAAAINADYGITSYSSKGRLDGLELMMMFMATQGVMGGNLKDNDNNNNMLNMLLLNGLN